MTGEPKTTIERIAHLDSRVTGLEQGMKDVVFAVRELSSDIKDEGRRRAEAVITAQTEARESNKTPWSVILSGGGLAVTIIIAIGTLAYLPIRETQNDFKGQLKDVVPRVEHERIWRWQERLGETFDRRIQRLEDKLDRRP